MPWLLRRLVLWVALTAGWTLWSMHRGDMGVTDALPPGVAGGTVLTIAVVLVLRKLRRGKSTPPTG